MDTTERFHARLEKAVLSVRLRALNRWAMAHRVALGLNGTLGDPVA
jgi:hypothetical protein